MGFYGPLPYPPYRTGKGWPISVPLITYNKGTIKVWATARPAMAVLGGLTLSTTVGNKGNKGPHNKNEFTS